MIADTAEELTPEFLSEFLSGGLSGGGSDTSIVGAQSRPIGTGQMGSMFRVSLTYAAGSSGPSTVIAKLGTPGASPQAAMGYRSEFNFYSKVQQAVAVKAPVCYAADISEDGTRFTLLLEDLDPAVPGKQVDGCTLEQAHAVVRNAAGLHGPLWDHPSLDTLGISRYGHNAELVAHVHQDATAKFIERYRDRLDPGVAETLAAAGEVTLAWIKTRASPATVVHGDYRPDNLMFHPDGTTYAVDWQTLSIAPGPRDVAYFLGTTLEPDRRRDHEHDLVAAYHEALLGHGVTDYPLGQCFDDYRLGQIQASLIMTTGAIYATAAPTPDSDAMFLAMANRAAVAINDLGTLRLIGD